MSNPKFPLKACGNEKFKRKLSCKNRTFCCEPAQPFLLYRSVPIDLINSISDNLNSSRDCSYSEAASR